MKISDDRHEKPAFPQDMPRGNSDMKRTTWVLLGNFEKNPKRHQEPALPAWLQFFHP